MSNSSLVSYIKISPNKTSPRNHAIDTITIHCMAGDLTIETCGEVFAPTARQASSNYGIGTDGRIGMYVEEKDRSWCTSSPANDHRAVTIEVANDGGESTGWHVSDKAMNSLIELCADICRRNNISKLKWEGNPLLIGSLRQNMTVHRWFNATACPGDYLYSKHSYIAAEVNKKLLASSTPGQVPGIKVNATSTNSSLYNYINPISLVDASKITPYVATLGPEIKHVDYKKLRNSGVVGVMLYGGAYYSIMHTVREKYRGDNLSIQVEGAKNADMPYALYVHVRARSVEEAKLECKQLRYLISKYSPQLGIWLTLQTMSSKAVNDKILEEYYNQLVRWGMKDRFGIYTDRSGLDSITWNKFYDRYLLWLHDPVTTMAGVDDTLLTPEFFMI